jgi:hypothetical protein
MTSCLKLILNFHAHTHAHTHTQLLGNNAYVVYTLDKVVQQLVKCLTSMAADPNVTRLVGLYLWHRTRGQRSSKGSCGSKLTLSGKGVDPHLYHAHVSAVLSQTLEDVYKIQFVTAGEHEIEGESVVAIEVVPKLSGFSTEPLDPSLVSPTSSQVL